jgi:PAS domain S-box-containing protein
MPAEHPTGTNRIIGVGGCMDFQSHKETDIILDSIADGVFTIDKDWRITSFNRAAERITGVKPGGRRGSAVLRSVSRERMSVRAACALRRTLATGRPIVNKAVYIFDVRGNRRKPITISTALLKDETGQVVGGVETFRDMTLVEELRKQVLKQYLLRGHHQQEPESPATLRRAAPGGRERLHGADRGGDGYGQGVVRPRGSQSRPTQERALHRG